MRAVVVVVVAACGLLLTTGCGETRAAPERAGSPGPLVTFVRGGGLAGEIVRVEVGRRGRVVPRPDGRLVRLGAAELARLRGELRAARLDRPDPDPSGPPVPDGFGYRVRSAAGTLTFGEEGPPARARPLVRRLQGLLRRTGAG